MSNLKITLIQSDLKWENKSENLKLFEEKIQSIGSATHLIILPEMFSTGFSMRPEMLAETMDGDTMSWMKRVAKENRVIITGSIIIEENKNYYNRLVWMLPNGEMGYYDKRHLFGFAGEDKHYTAGKNRLIASVNGWKIHLQICYDLRFPVWSRQQPQKTVTSVEPEFDVLIYVANWPERRKHAWQTLLQARAIENQCYVVGVNRVGYDGHEIYHSGNSMVVDPMGEILFHEADKETISTQILDKLQLDTIRNKLPFLKDADYFTILP